MSILAAVLLAGSVTIAQTATDMATLERRVEDAQAAYDRVQTAGDDTELREIQDDLAYLRVKARRGMTVTNTERRELGERIDRFMTRLSSRTANTADQGTRAARQPGRHRPHEPGAPRGDRSGCPADDATVVRRRPGRRPG